jgi:geranylgeranyl diphosphate synthase type I
MAEDVCALVDADLARFLATRRSELEETGPLIDEISRLMAAGGKRLRPAFCYWGYRAAGGAHDDAIVRTAAGLELLHTFAIVHDDIMDHADERRGQPTTQALLGIDVAILVGDLALVLADAAFMSSGFESRAIASAFDVYSLMRQEVIGGQYLDVKSAQQTPFDVAHARRIAVLKSGRYSVEKPLKIGATLGEASSELLEQLRQFGAPLGEAFQLRDDLLGLFGTRSSLGKPVDSDIRQGKRHVLYAQTVAALDGQEREWFDGHWGGGEGLTNDDVDRLRALVEASGARAATEGLLEDLKSRSLEALDGLKTDDAARAALRDLALRATERAV